MVLDNYIKQDFVKQVFMESCLFISDIWQAETLAKSYLGHRLNIIFESSYIKYAFFNKLKLYHPNIKVVSCDASKLRFIKDLEDYNKELIIFDRVNYLIDISIFNMINKMNRILVC